MKLRVLLAIGLTGAAVFALTRVVFAAAQYHWNWGDAPVWGNHWWYNNQPSSAHVTWDADNLWTTDNLNLLKRRHRHAGIQYQLENEAYKPPASYCDRLNISLYVTLGLPVEGFVPGNGCGSSAVQEELKVLLDEMALSANAWYRYRVTFSKTGCNVYPNEVNYSFSTTTSWSDDWLGKIYLDSSCNRTLPSDPPGMVN